MTFVIDEAPDHALIMMSREQVDYLYEVTQRDILDRDSTFIAELLSLLHTYSSTFENVANPDYPYPNLARYSLFKSELETVDGVIWNLVNDQLLIEADDVDISDAVEAEYGINASARLVETLTALNSVEIKFVNEVMGTEIPDPGTIVPASE